MTRVIKVITEGPQGPQGATGASGSATLAGLTDVTGTAGTGKAPVSDGAGHFALTDIATQTELDAAVAALSSVYQPLDSDLTAIAALTTTSFGRSLLALVDAAALRTAAGLGTAATQNTTAFDAAGAAAAAQAASQPLDSDLTAIAALTTTSFGRAFLALADAAAARTAIGTVIGTDVEAHDADLTAIAALDSSTAGAIASDGAGWIKKTYAQFKTALGLTSSDVGLGNVTNNAQLKIASNLSDLASASTARTNLGVAIGTDVEAHDADLTTIAGLTPTNDDVIQRKAGAWTNRTLAQLIADLGALGTTFQPLDSDLTALAGLTSAADKLPYFTGSAAAAVTTLSSFIRTLLDDADAATARATLGALVSTSTLDAIATANATAADVALNSHKLTGVTDGTSAQDAATYGELLGRSRTINPTSVITQTWPSWAGTTSTTNLTSGTVYLAAVWLDKGTVVTSIRWCSSSQALVTGTHQIFGLYDSSLNRLAISTDDTSTAWGTSATKTLSLTPGTFTTTYTGLHYIAVLVTASTCPNLFCTNSFATVLGNPALFGPTASTGQTSLPNPVGAITAQDKVAYAAVL